MSDGRVYIDENRMKTLPNSMMGFVKPKKKKEDNKIRSKRSAEWGHKQEDDRRYIFIQSISSTVLSVENKIVQR